MGCMKETDGADTCPYCGFSRDTLQSSPFLPLGSVVAGRYLIGKVLEHNGEGAVYIGYDLEQSNTVNIREFLPQTVADRATGSSAVSVMPGRSETYAQCLSSFLELWRKLARMRGLSALICVIDIVEDNGTAYSVYEAVHELRTVREYLLDTPAGYVTWDQARVLFMPLLSTLGTLHSAGIIHRGISPTTLLIGKDGKLLITGFCTREVRCIDGCLPTQIFTGYAPVEQCGAQGRHGPWTDVYAFAAVMYRALVGSTPVDSTSRMVNDKLMIPAKFAEQLPAYVINALVNALQILPGDRTASVEALRNDFSASPVAAANSDVRRIESEVTEDSRSMDRIEVVDPKAEQKEKKEKRKSSATKFVITCALCLAALSAVLVFIYFGGFGGGHNEGETTTAAAEPTFSVSNFVGRLQNEVIADEYFNKYYDFNVEFVYNDTAAPGTIVAQSVESGTLVPTGEKIKITLQVSNGIEYVKITLSEFVGLDAELAAERLTTLGFKCKTDDTVQPPTDASAGKVFNINGQDSGELSLPRGTEITVYSYIGNVKINVADYINRDAKEVKTALEALGLTCTEDTTAFITTSPEAVGKVARINQSMTGQLEIRKGSTVTLYVYAQSVVTTAAPTTSGTTARSVSAFSLF